LLRKQQIIFRGLLFAAPAVVFVTGRYASYSSLLPELATNDMNKWYRDVEMLPHLRNYSHSRSRDCVIFRPTHKREVSSENSLVRSDRTVCTILSVRSKTRTGRKPCDPKCREPETEVFHQIFDWLD